MNTDLLSGPPPAPADADRLADLVREMQAMLDDGAMRKVTMMVSALGGSAPVPGDASYDMILSTMAANVIFAEELLHKIITPKLEAIDIRLQRLDNLTGWSVQTIERLSNTEPSLLKAIAAFLNVIEKAQETANKIDTAQGTITHSFKELNAAIGKFGIAVTPLQDTAKPVDGGGDRK